MNESLAAACREFEQTLLADMLRSAGMGRNTSDDAPVDDASESGFSVSAQTDAVQQLFVQALSGAIVRAGGVGLAQSLMASLAKVTR